MVEMGHFGFELIEQRFAAMVGYRKKMGGASLNESLYKSGGEEDRIAIDYKIIDKILGYLRLNGSFKGVMSSQLEWFTRTSLFLASHYELWDFFFHGSWGRLKGGCYGEDWGVWGRGAVGLGRIGGPVSCYVSVGGGQDNEHSGHVGCYLRARTTLDMNVLGAVCFMRTGGRKTGSWRGQRCRGGTIDVGRVTVWGLGRTGEDGAGWAVGLRGNVGREGFDGGEGGWEEESWAGEVLEFIASRDGCGDDLKKEHVEGFWTAGLVFVWLEIETTVMIVLLVAMDVFEVLCKPCYGDVLEV
ncbi:hypothetical protein Tco_0820413 [Tanacetum coccineum]|uniref:Uncharacterized protein n=1 Tax=Tanacetum coccineum TaxID=301880 RepID=A0ABQ5AE33_9ASTR